MLAHALSTVMQTRQVLVCEGEITSCAISPDRGEIVVAATREGSLFVWDLREDAQVRGPAVCLSVRHHQRLRARGCGCECACVRL